jgi:hypothetical protein
MGAFALLYILLQKRLSMVFNYMILLVSAVVVFTGSITVEDLQENLKWGFYILAIQDVIWFAFLIFVVSSYWKLFKAQADGI